MLLRFLKAQGLVLICGGLVGPIFLVAYFVLGQSPLMRWMFWWGLLLTAGNVLAALALAANGAKAAAKTQRLEQQGVLALAEITGMTETGTRINAKPLVKLNLRISGEGIAAFDTEDRVLASLHRLPMITARRLVALVDPATNEYQIDWDRSALVSGMAPAKFTLDQDNRTYDLTAQAEPLLQIMGILKANGIPISETIDVRSNPVVRQQVMNIVRHAAQNQAAAAPPVGEFALPKPPEPSTAQRLQELETLRVTGSITDAEYTAKRQQIIAEL
jgi:hypothetical protein